MAGLGSRFTEYGFITNKYLLPIHTSLQPMIEKAIASLDISVPCEFIYIIREEGVENTSLRNILGSISKKYGISYKIHGVSHLTEGPAATVYEARHLLDPTMPLIVSNSDQVLEWNFSEFYKTCQENDGCVLTYIPAYTLELGTRDKHSFLRLDHTGRVIECREKIVLSKNALVGVHYFKTANYFLDAYEYMIQHQLRAPNGEFYLSLAYQAMLEMGKTVGYYDIASCNGAFYPVGEPEDYFSYLYQKGGYQDTIRLVGDHTVIVETDRFRVRYEVYGANLRIQNEGMILIVDGCADTDGICLCDGDITNNDLFTHSVCSVIHIWYKEYTPSKKQIYNTYEFTRGWFLGDFTPSILSTKEFEVGLLKHLQGEKWGYHYHKEATEYNLLLKGTMLFNGKKIEKGTAFTNYPNEIACPIFLEDCQVLCVKVPSVPTDKYII